MLLDEYIEIVVAGHTLNYYRSKGYEVPTYIDKRYNKERVKKGTTIIVKVEDLVPNSHIKIHAKCDNCGEITTPTYQNYLKSISSGNDGKHYCHRCSFIHNKQTNIERYGTESPRQNKKINDKAMRTSQKRYGGNSPACSKEVINKIKNTNMERYGVENVFCLEKNKEFLKKIFIEKYGTSYPFQSDKYWEEQKQKNIDQYGCEWFPQIPEVREKINKTFMKNNSMKSSSQQRYICDLYDGNLNYLVSHFFVDIYIEKDNICCEYDGGGHNLNVVTGRLTQEEFDKKEMIRERIIRSSGHRLIRIISPTDMLPLDNILLQMLNDALEYFNLTNHTWRNYYIEEGIFKDAEHKNGECYAFGELRKIKQTA